MGMSSYEIEFMPNQQRLPVNPFEIIDDQMFEGDEVFSISLSLGPGENSVTILLESSIAAIIIQDDDREYNIHKWRVILYHIYFYCSIFSLTDPAR